MSFPVPFVAEFSHLGESIMVAVFSEYLTDLTAFRLLGPRFYTVSRIMQSVPSFSYFGLRVPKLELKRHADAAISLTFYVPLCRRLVDSEIFLPGNPCLWSRRLEASKHGNVLSAPTTAADVSMQIDGLTSYISSSLAAHFLLWSGASALWGELNHIDFNLFKLVSGHSLSSDIFGGQQAAGELIMSLQWGPEKDWRWGPKWKIA